MVTAHVYTSDPCRSDTIFGRTGPTIVWSSADRNMPSRTAPRISSLARMLRPSAGSSAIDGVCAPGCSIAFSGNDSIRSSFVLWGAEVAGRRSVRRVGEVVLVGRTVVDLGREGPPKAAQRLEDDRPLGRGQPTDDGAEPLALRGLRLDERLQPGPGGTDEDEAPIVGHA